MYRLGLGTASLAGVNMVGAAHYRPPTGEAVDRLLLTFRDLAGQDNRRLMIDTSAQYGDSETLLGSFLKQHPDSRRSFYIATKWGLRFHPRDFGRSDYSVAHLEQSFARSAELLGRIDLLYLHTNPSVSPVTLASLLEECGGVVDIMRRLKAEQTHGVTHLGISVSTRKLLDLLLRRPVLLRGFDVLQLNANLVVGRPGIASALRGTGLLAVLNSIYRKGDPFLRGQPRGAAALFHRALDACGDAIVLTGTSSPDHLRAVHGYIEDWLENHPVSLRYMSNGYDPAQTTAVENALTGYFSHFKSCESRREPSTIQGVSPDALVDVLIGSGNTRLGPVPGTRERAILRSRIESFTREYRPIEVFLTWGPRKFFVRGDENRVDIAEAVALERLYDIDVEVRKVFAPGLTYTLFYEDFEGGFIEQEPASMFDAYASGLQQLITVLDIRNIVRLVRTSQWLTMSGREGEIIKQLEVNYDRIRRYWWESNGASCENTENLSSYREMANLGFVGPISRATRNHYLRRLDRLLGNLYSVDRKQDTIIRLFACVLLHRQFDMFDNVNDLPPVKFSFLRTAGGPDWLKHGRLDIRSIKAKVTRRSLAPWSAKGFLRKKNGGVLPALRTQRDGLATGERWREGNLTFERGDQRITLRADLLENASQAETS